MKNIAIFVLAFAMCVSMASATATWAYCDSTVTYTLTVSSVTLNPDPPVAGTNDVVTLVGNINETVTSGSITLNIVWGILTVYSHTYNVCTDAGVTCPIAAGAITAAVTVDGSAIPVALPGNLVGTATFTDQNGATVGCVAVTFTF